MKTEQLQTSEMSFIEKYNHELWKLTVKTTTEKPKGEDELKLQSIIGMVHTLVQDGQIAKLDKALKENFSEYYYI